MDQKFALEVHPAPLYAGVSKTKRGAFGHRPRGFDAWQLIFGMRGKGQLIYPGGRRLINPGDILLFAPGTAQHYGNPGPARWEHLFFVFHTAPHFQRWLSLSEIISPGIGFLHPRSEFSAIRRTLLEALRLGMSSHHFGRELALHSLYQALIRCHAENLSTEVQEIDPRISRWIEELGDDMRKSHLPIREMARQMGMSPTQLARAFHRQMGLSPVQYLEKMRLERAAELLRGSAMRVREISEAMGYDDPLYFSSRFRAVLGQSPRHYRQAGEEIFPAYHHTAAEVSPAHHFERSRLEKSAEVLVATSLPLTEIAESFNFENLAKFSERFRAVMGMSPLQYRRQHQRQVKS